MQYIVGEVDEEDRAAMPEPAEKFEELLTRLGIACFELLDSY